MSEVRNISKAGRKRLLELADANQAAQAALQSFIDYLKEEYEVDDTWKIKPDASAFVRESNDPAAGEQDAQ